MNNASEQERVPHASGMSWAETVLTQVPHTSMLVIMAIPEVMCMKILSDES